MDVRILLVDIGIAGHRKDYINALRTKENIFVLLPENHNIEFPHIKMASKFNLTRNIITYLKLIEEINNVVKHNRIDIVHLLCGDAIYRFFGLALKRIRAKVIITFHHMIFSKSRLISIRKIFANIDYGIVHTEYLYNHLKTLKIDNVKHIEYPAFNHKIDVESQESKKFFNLPLNKPVLGVLGGMARYKGLDILLEALPMVTKDFHLLIAGTEGDFSAIFIKKNSESYKNQVTLALRYLDNMEYQSSLNAIDILVLPYRYSFNGASGPLAESTVYRKMIIASGHGSLGKIVSDNHLGDTFETENPEMLAKTIDYALTRNFVWDCIAEEYRTALSPKDFQRKYEQIYLNLNSKGVGL